ncbi:transposase [Escherichia coli]|nr:transposase [Escherichia coli]KLH12023.1 transposase [Escherichia coli]
MALICKLSQQWSFVGSKARQHWLWYVYNTKTGGVLAYTFGPRTDETCRELRALLTLLPSACWPLTNGVVTLESYRRRSI